MISKARYIRSRIAKAGPGIYFLGLLSPATSLLVAIRNFRKGWAKNVLWFFVIFYGFTFVISNDQLDASRYKRELVRLYDSPVNSLGDFWDLLYNEETNYVDVLQPLVTFLVSRITDDSRILFALFGVIFGYFYSRNIWFLIERTEGKLFRSALVFLALYAVTVAFWQLNGFRFYTGVHVFIYGFLSLLSGRKKIRALLICISSLFVHFSMIFPVMLLLVYLVAGNRLFAYFIIYFLSFFVSQVTPTLLRTYSESLPAVFQKRSDRYVSDEYLETREKQAQEKLNWYVNGRIEAIRYAVLLCLLWVFFRHQRLVPRNLLWHSMLCYGLILASAVNVISSLPSMIRFYSIFYMLIFGCFFLMSQQLGKRIFPVLIQIPLFAAALLFIVVEVRLGFDTIGVLTVLGNPVLALFIHSDIPLIDLIK